MGDDLIMWDKRHPPVFNRLAIQRFKEAIQQLGVGISRVAVVGFNRTTQQLIHTLQERTSNGYEFVGILLGERPPSQPIPHRIPP